MVNVVDKILGVLDSAVSSIGNAISTVLGNLIGKILYYITYGVCEIIRVAYSIFSVFSGITKVSVNGKYQYLTNFFFENDIVSSVYWGMVMIGVVLVFAFAIVSVIRKIFDLYDKQQHSIGQILTGCFKAIFIMLCMTFFMSTAMSLTNELVRRVDYVFDENKNLTDKTEIVFTDEQFATMARIFNTIGNYSLNPSYNQRFNLNACYNEIRPDLLILQEQGVFDMMYTDPGDEEGESAGESWQSALEKLAIAGNPSELMMDAYYDGISEELLNIMDQMRNNANFKPLQSFTRRRSSTQTVSLDCIVFLSGTMTAANDPIYNVNPSLDDPLRGSFLHSDTKIYNFKEVSKAFNVGLGGISYLLIWFTAFFVLQALMRTILACAARMINIVGLYLIAPPVVAAMPLDDGQKFKEWITSMVIQMLGIFGSIIPMRLVLLFLPMILDDGLVLSSSVTINALGKIFLIAGLLKGVDRFGSILTGILANSAGQAAIRASDLNDDSDRLFDKYIGQHVPGLRNFASATYMNAKRQSESQPLNNSSGGSGYGGGNVGGNGGGNGGGYGSSNSNALPGKSPQYPSMNQSMGSMGNMGNMGSMGSMGGMGNGAPKPGDKSFGGNQNLDSSTAAKFGDSSLESSSFGLPGKVPTEDSMNSSSLSNDSLFGDDFGNPNNDPFGSDASAIFGDSIDGALPGNNNNMFADGPGLPDASFVDSEMSQDFGDFLNSGNLNNSSLPTNKTQDFGGGSFDMGGGYANPLNGGNLGSDNGHDQSNLNKTFNPLPKNVAPPQKQSNSNPNKNNKKPKGSN